MTALPEDIQLLPLPSVRHTMSSSSTHSSSPARESDISIKDIGRECAFHMSMELHLCFTVRGSAKEPLWSEFRGMKQKRGIL